MNVLISCYSTAPDREHDAVAADMGSLFVRELENRQFAFHNACKLDDKLYSHEYHCARLSLPVVRDEIWEAPDGLLLLSTKLSEMDLEETELTGPELPFLVVESRGFHFNFVAGDAYGNPVTYETDVFTLDDVRSVLKL